MISAWTRQPARSRRSSPNRKPSQPFGAGPNASAGPVRSAISSWEIDPERLRMDDVGQGMTEIIKSPTSPVRDKLGLHGDKQPGKPGYRAPDELGR